MTRYRVFLAAAVCFVGLIVAACAQKQVAHQVSEVGGAPVAAADEAAAAPEEAPPESLLEKAPEPLPALEGAAAPPEVVVPEAPSRDLEALPMAVPSPKPAPPPPPASRAAVASPSPGKFASEFALGRVRKAPPGTGQDKPSYEGFGQVFDEVWVIQRPERQVAAAPVDEVPGSGELRAKLAEEKEIPLPLEHTDVRAGIEGYIATVQVAQHYHNPYDEKIEAVYVFPLPQDAAVSDFVMTIGDRHIRGIIREREEAQRLYTEARRQGYQAALLTQERPNVFTQKVANLEPGKRIDIDITYFHTLAYHDGEYAFVFPMVVGPRYNPPGHREGIGAVGRGRAGASGQPVEVPYLKPGERSGHDISLAVEVDAGVSLERIYSHTHAIAIERTGRGRAQVRIRPSDTLPNKDFVVRYRVAGDEVKTALLTERNESGRYFTLILQPPGNLEDLPRTGQEMVFVLDVSGSMNGWPIEKARAALTRALQNLRPEDTFQIVQFAGHAAVFAPTPVPATPENIAAGLAYAASLRSGGGTEMLGGIRAALDFPHDERRLRVVSFLTDGYIGNEDQIFRAVSEKLGPSRIFSFGVGSSVNRYLIEGLARLGRGAVAYVTLRDSDVEAVDRFYERIAHPALTDIAIDWGGMEVTEVYPKQVPDLFVGRPVILTGRFTGHGETAVRVSGKVAGERQSFTVDVDLDDREARREGISKIWARARIAALMDEMATRGGRHLAGEVQTTALAHGLVSAYTAFVAVDSTRRTAGEHGTTVAQPVPVPEGVRYETTVPE